MTLLSPKKAKQKFLMRDTYIYTLVCEHT